MERIGKYELCRVVGEGSTSTVFLARDPFTGGEVAIKRLRPELVGDSARGRLCRIQLLNEAALAGKLVHPHIARIHDAVVNEHEAYVVMEYVRGGTLEARCTPDRLLPYERLIEILFKCTRALDFAYRHGITHRDIKPANILLVAEDGRDIKLSDFGSAFQAAADATQIAGIGSPAYMSPQQVREMPLDHRSDIYSLGVVMFQLLTGRLPFVAQNNYGLLYSIVNDEAPPPSAVRAGIPPALDAIVRRATEKDLERRYQDWSEFSRDLALAFRNHELHLATPAPPDSEKFEALRGLAFFRDFSDVELWEIIGFSRWEWSRPGTVLMREGETGAQVCLLAAGEARVSKRGQLLGMLSAGECFGEMALFAAGGTVRSATVEADGMVLVATVDQDALERASDTCRMHFYRRFLETLATRLSLANARIANQ